MTYRRAGTHRQAHTALLISYECKYVIQRDLGEVVFSAVARAEGWYPRTLTGTILYGTQDPEDALLLELGRQLDCAPAY